MLLVFGGETLRDFAFAMMVGVASGTYSSIFIASPVLTAWKEREPAYRSRRARILEAMGYVPAFPEDNVVARIDEVERHVPSAEAGDHAPEPAVPAPAPPPTDQPVAHGRAAGRATPPRLLPADGRDARAGAAASTPTGAPKSRAQRKSRRQRRRKHGRNR